jgi:hypothetical protein
MARSPCRKIGADYRAIRRGRKRSLRDGLTIGQGRQILSLKAERRG